MSVENQGQEHLLLDPKIQLKWLDNSIPNRAKHEAMQMMRWYMGYKSDLSVQNLMRRKKIPTPRQRRYITRLVNRYWAEYNQIQVAPNVEQGIPELDFSSTGSALPTN